MRQIYKFLAEAGNHGQIRTFWAKAYHMGIVWAYQH